MPADDLRVEHLVSATGDIAEWLGKLRELFQTRDANDVIADPGGTNITAGHLVTSLNYLKAWTNAVRQALEAAEVVDDPAEGSVIRFPLHPEVPYPLGGAKGEIATCPRPGPIYAGSCGVKIWKLKWPESLPLP